MNACSTSTAVNALPAADPDPNPPPAPAIVPFGTRFLTDDTQVFEHNAWDQVQFSESDMRDALDTVSSHSKSPVDPLLNLTIQANPALYWDLFYSMNQTHFFKDRNWLVSEFKQSHLFTFSTSVPTSICEFGCGTGATIYPILKFCQSNDFLVNIHACDFSSTAIDLVKNNPLYDPQCVNALVFDMANPCLPSSIPHGSVDYMVLIFAISALPFSRWDSVFANVYRLLKPGGILLLRDYARLDLAQVRMKPGRYLDQHLYMRGDNTLVYFTTTDEVSQLATHHGFQILQLGLDQRLLVNRKKKLRMHRLWVHGKLKKPLNQPSCFSSLPLNFATNPILVNK